MKLPAPIIFICMILSPACFPQDTILRKVAPLKIMSRDTSVPIVVPGRILDGDTIPLVDLRGYTVIPQPKFVNYNELLKYEKLVYRVRIVYPYAKLAARKFEEYQKILDTIPRKKERRQFIRKAEKELEDQFGEEIKNLSIYQGKILIKLIYRETGNTTFEIVKELRGSFSAFIRQSMAGLFGYDLKTGFDPASIDEDQTIEQIIQMIDAGLL